ncbi:MAG: hypothetical protein PHQ86_05125 [Dehalococcoidales bacterium]|nr:hypothetical protein [Dehalococcoidales bacterium]
MAILAWTFGTIGGLCAIMGILTATAVIPEYAELSWMFWMVLSALSLLVTIAFAVSCNTDYD